MKKIFFSGVVVLMLCACKHNPNDKTSDNKTDAHQVVDTIDLNLTILKSKILENGIEIEWLQEGDGIKVEEGHVYNIDYKVRLEDSTIIDGVHLLNKPFIPYLVGYKMQPEGWDLTLNELHVGDFVKAKIPSKYLRGEKEVKGLIPKNANNLLNVRVINEVMPTRIVDGVKVWVMSETDKKTPVFGEEMEIEFFTMISTKSNPFYFNSFATNKPFKMNLSDKGIIPGLKKALINSKKGDRLLILVPSSQAYGSKGMNGLVKPNEDIFFNLYVNDVIKL